MAGQYQHGVPVGRVKHRLEGTEPCAACMDAHNDNRRAWRVENRRTHALLVPVATLADLLGGADPRVVLTAALGVRTIAAVRTLRPGGGPDAGETAALQESPVPDQAGGGGRADGAAAEPPGVAGLSVRQAYETGVAPHQPRPIGDPQ
jgi:hypothetical protein